MKRGKEHSRKLNNVGVGPGVRNSWVSSGAEFNFSQLGPSESGGRWHQMGL